MKKIRYQNLLALAFCFLFLFFHFFSSSAQIISLLSSNNLSTNNLNSSQQTNLAKFSMDALYENSQLISVGNLINTQKDGRVKISLPIFSCPNLIFSAVSVEYINENDYYWYGTIDNEVDSACNSGSITLFSRGGQKFGNIIIDSNFFEYSDLGDGVQVLARYKLELMEVADCGVNENTFVGNDTIFYNKVLPCQGNCDVRVLVLYTQAAQNIETNIDNRIALAIAQTNQGLTNSFVGRKDVNIVLAGSQLIDFVEGNDMQGDVIRLISLPSVQTIRNSFQADLVILLTNGNYGAFEGIVRAIGPSVANAFGLVQTKAATVGRFVFAHEIGHLFGARHNNDVTGTIEHGFTFRTGFIFTKKRYTLMASTPAKDREQFFSNPSVYIKGKSIGTLCCNNVAQMFRNNGCLVANFFTNPSNFKIDIINISVTGCEIGRAEAQVQCGIAPYIYIWEIGYDGINWVGAGTTETTSFSISCNQSSLLWVRLTVTDSNGQLLRAVKTYTLTGKAK